MKSNQLAVLRYAKGGGKSIVKFSPTIRRVRSAGTGTPVSRTKTDIAAAHVLFRDVIERTRKAEYRPIRWIAPLLLVGAAVAWIAVLTSLNVAAQSVVPDWVRARDFAVYLMVQFGATTAGSAIWRFFAQEISIQATLLLAAGGGVIAGLFMAFFAKLPKEEDDLSPSLHWPEPIIAGDVDSDRGPVMITISYQIDPLDRQSFLKALQRLATVRQRDGAFNWHILEDAAHPSIFKDVFFDASWLDHLRQHQRITGADVMLQNEVIAFYRGGTRPQIRHLIGAQPYN